ncbi:MULTISPECIES: hemerythrin domain-containing protein [Paraburkholderia]|uniref:Hemerythrin-like domain-containing protein n=1 Tax=Paraburkholderia youngii TaxID=2782701 RepID=A0A7Y6JX12_9BURK|nr:hemerythrin domain-containing protein [Paraburkholderia youngii]NUX99504.1 hypothetical protein [Paraburkholderia youngii]
MKSRPSNRQTMSMNVYESLDETHRAIVLHLERLKLLAQLLPTAPSNETVRGQVREVIDFFTGASREHHYDEEKFVFPPLLAGTDATVHKVIERLREDHAWIELQWLDIQAQLETSAEGASAKDGQDLIAAIDDFALLMHDHMALEESTLHSVHSAD